MTRKKTVFLCGMFAGLFLAGIIPLGLYYWNLNPNLIAEFTVDEVHDRCPEMKEWVLHRTDWEWVPFVFLPKIVKIPNSGDKCMFAIYETKIVRFEPYTFHATKGRLVMTNGSEKTIYIFMG